MSLLTTISNFLKSLFKRKKVMQYTPTSEHELFEQVVSNEDDLGVTEVAKIESDISPEIIEMLRRPEIDGWLSDEDRITRFNNFDFKKFILQSKTDNIKILDLGCGTGKLYEYLDQLCKDINKRIFNGRRFTIEYTGIDLRDQILDLSWELYKQPENCKFISADVYEYASNPENYNSYDMVVCNGLFNIVTDIPNADDSGQTVILFINSLYNNFCSQYLMFNLLTDIPSDSTEEDKASLLSYDQESMFKFYFNMQKSGTYKEIYFKYSSPDLDASYVLCK